MREERGVQAEEEVYTDVGERAEDLITYVGCRRCRTSSGAPRILAPPVCVWVCVCVYVSVCVCVFVCVCVCEADVVM